MKWIGIVAALLIVPTSFGQGRGEGRRTQPQQELKEGPVLDEGVAEYVGQVQAAETVQQLAPFAGRTVRQLVPPGTLVKAGQPIVVLSQKTLGEAYANFTAKANLSGILNEYHVNPGNEFSSGAPLFTILDNSNLRIKIFVSNKDHAQITAGDKVTLVPEGQGRKPVAGSVYRKSLIPVAGSGLFEVEIDVPKELTIGTFCRIKFQAPDALAGEPESDDKRRRKGQ